MSPFTRLTLCAWCGGTPTAEVTVTPAEYKNLTLVHPSVVTDVCEPCSKRLHIYPMHTTNIANRLLMRKAIAADNRREQRETWRAQQGSLFTVEHKPKHPSSED